MKGLGNHESFWLAMSEPPELPRSKIRSTRAAVSGRARSRATRRGNILRETPRDHCAAGAHGAASQFQGDLRLCHHYGSIILQELPSSSVPRWPLRLRSPCNMLNSLFCILLISNVLLVLARHNSTGWPLPSLHYSRSSISLSFRKFE